MDEIETRRLLMRPFRASDAPDYFAFAKNPNVGFNAGWKPHESLEETQQTIENLSLLRQVWAIEEKTSGRMIGTISLLEDKRRNLGSGAYVIGYVLGEEFWGRGYMTEGVRGIIAYAFRVRKCLIIGVDHYPGNERSRRVIKKCGFVYEGRLRMAARQWDGRILDVLCYSLTREEYLDQLV